MSGIITANRNNPLPPSIKKNRPDWIPFGLDHSVASNDLFIRFSSSSKPEENPPKTWDVLFREEFLAVFKMAIKAPFWVLISIAFPLPSMGNLIDGFRTPVLAPLRFISAIRARGKFNETGEAQYLNSLLPYRKSIQSNPTALKRYEQLVEEVIKKSDFIEISESLKTFNHQLMKYCSQHFPNYKEEMTQLDKILPKSAIKRFAMRYQDKGELAFYKAEYWKLNAQYFKQIPFEQLELEKKPVTDLSLKYLIAASIVEGFHNQPQIIQRVLNAPQKLKFVIHEKDSAASGSRIPGLNAITLGKLFMGGLSIDIALHEFVHAVTEKEDMPQFTFPEFSQAEEKEYQSIAQELKAQYLKYDKTLWGRLRSFVTGTTSTGIQHYAFGEDAEYPTSTVELFMGGSKALRKTPAGKRLYDFYKTFFQMDPLENYRDLP